jgi:D-alanyl-lipoteichoic acid acyltransferase DltB (MBOAT superfamily)
VNEIYLLLLATLIALFLRLAGLVRSEEARSILISTLSLFCAYQITKSAWLVAAILAWAVACFGLLHLLSRVRTETRFRMVAAYIGSVGLVFVTFKTGHFGNSARNILLDQAVPFGFSFLMFQSISHFLTTYQRPERPLPPLAIFLRTLLFFPALFCGPFVRAEEIVAVQSGQDAGMMNLFRSYCLVCLGIFKFSLSAFLRRILYPIPLTAAATLEKLHPATTFLIASLYLYANFSGFSDVVVGLARILGYEVPRNFQFPFFSRSIGDYWRKWHISLGNWFRLHVYFPVNYTLSGRFGGRPGALRVSGLLATALCFLLIAFWHEISWKFFLYGVANFLFVFFLRTERWSRLVSVPLTFAIIVLLTGLFLSRDVESFFALLTLGMKTGLTVIDWKVILLWAALMAYLFAADELVKIARPHSARYYRLGILACFLMSVLNLWAGITVSAGSSKSVYMGY